MPHGRPISTWGYWGDPAMPRDALTPLDGRYTDNDSWSTNELDIDWQGVTLYLGEPQPKGARVLEPRLNSPHAKKTLQSRLKSPDRL